MAQILRGLKAVHRAGYVHADLKPTNLLFGLGEPEEAMKKVYIVDFGLSRKFKDSKGRHYQLNRNQGTRGTMSYMSRHTQEGLTMARRDDIESLGYVMIYLVNGMLPWSKLKSTQK